MKRNSSARNRNQTRDDEPPPKKAREGGRGRPAKESGENAMFASALSGQSSGLSQTHWGALCRVDWTPAPKSDIANERSRRLIRIPEGMKFLTLVGKNEAVNDLCAYADTVYKAAQESTPDERKKGGEDKYVVVEWFCFKRFLYDHLTKLASMLARTLDAVAKSTNHPSVANADALLTSVINLKTLMEQFQINFIAGSWMGAIFEHYVFRDRPEKLAPMVVIFVHEETSSALRAGVLHCFHWRHLPTLPPLTEPQTKTDDSEIRTTAITEIVKEKDRDKLKSLLRLTVPPLCSKDEFSRLPTDEASFFVSRRPVLSDVGSRLIICGNRGVKSLVCTPNNGINSIHGGFLDVVESSYAESKITQTSPYGNLLPAKRHLFHDLPSMSVLATEAILFSANISRSQSKKRKLEANVSGCDQGPSAGATPSIAGTHPSPAVTYDIFEHSRGSSKTRWLSIAHEIGDLLFSLYSVKEFVDTLDTANKARRRSVSKRASLTTDLVPQNG